MDDHSFKKEYESIINGYSDKFIYLLFAYILSSIYNRFFFISC